MNGMEENFVPTASPVVIPNSAASHHVPLTIQRCSQYKANSVVPAAATSSVARAACPRIGGMVASMTTASNASDCVAAIRRAHSHMDPSNSTKNGIMPSRASVRYSS